MTQYESIRDILESYLPFNFNDKNIINDIMYNCGVFLRNKNIDENVLKNFYIEFNLYDEQSLIKINGNNLLSTLWIINVFPPNPEKLIFETVFNSGEFTYVYKAKDKSLKIVENGGIGTNASDKNARKSRKIKRNK